MIKDKKPHFMGVDDVLRYNTERTRELMRQELTIRLDEVEGEWHYTSLEKIFFENKVYKVLENDAAQGREGRHARVPAPAPQPDYRRG